MALADDGLSQTINFEPIAGVVMQSITPHYLLMSETQNATEQSASGSWRFVLQQIDGSHRIEVMDDEPYVRGERLQLLAVLRGLEALEQPSNVTLITPSRYVGKGFRHGLTFWRENDWCWERFGEMTPIKNKDLWQRIDRSMAYHSIDCRIWNLEQAIQTAPQYDDNSPSSRKRTRRIRFDSACNHISAIAKLFADRFGHNGMQAAYGCA